MSSRSVVWIIVIIVVIGALIYLAFGSKFSGRQATNVVNTPSPASQTENTPSPTVQENVKTFDIEGKPFSFTPSEIRVKQGDRVKINFTNAQGFHDLTIEGYDAKTKQIQASQTDTIEFVADKKGTFEFFCGVGNHRAQGMKGSLIVE